MSDHQFEFAVSCTKSDTHAVIALWCRISEIKTGN